MSITSLFICLLHFILLVDSFRRVTASIIIIIRLGFGWRIGPGNPLPVVRGDCLGRLSFTYHNLNSFLPNFSCVITFCGMTVTHILTQIPTYPHPVAYYGCTSLDPSTPGDSRLVSKWLATTGTLARFGMLNLTLC